MNDTKRDDGGSAFPEVYTDTKGEQGEYYQETYSAGGMSLRDWFAGKAITGVMANTNVPEIAKVSNLKDAQIVAAWAYKIADALLEARQK